MRTFVWIGVLVICFVSGGATCARREAPLPFPPPPVVFDDMPTVEQLAAVVNRTDSIRELSSNSASVKVLTMPNLPKLGATLNLRRDRQFRLRANLPVVLTAGMDMGSNDEVFWFEVPEGIRKTLYYARHDQYKAQLNRAILPVDPTWIIDAIGLVHIDPATVVAGPVRRPDGKLEVRETMMMPDGMYQRVCFIEPSAGYVTNQYLYAPGGNLVATCRASEHEFHQESQCALPHTVELHLSPSVGPPLGMKLEIGSFAVNQLLSGDPQLFDMPQNAAEAVDLTTLSSPPPVIPGVPTVSPAKYTRPSASYSASRIDPIPLRGTVQR